HPGGAPLRRARSSGQRLEPRPYFATARGKYAGDVPRRPDHSTAASRRGGGAAAMADIHEGRGRRVGAALVSDLVSAPPRVARPSAGAPRWPACGRRGGGKLRPYMRGVIALKAHSSVIAAG